MTPTQWFAFGALACASFAVNAQPAPARPDPMDANATVPVVSYQSAFDAYQRASNEEQPSPDKVWRHANDEVARSDAHSGHSMPEATAAPAGHSGHSMPESTPAPAAHSGHSMPKATTAPTAPPKAPPADHSKHH